jgi:hypothetical protein
VAYSGVTPYVSLILAAENPTGPMYTPKLRRVLKEIENGVRDRKQWHDCIQPLMLRSKILVNDDFLARMVPK